jgi:hypothetical protein
VPQVLIVRAARQHRARDASSKVEAVICSISITPLAVSSKSRAPVVTNPSAPCGLSWASIMAVGETDDGGLATPCRGRRTGVSAWR